VSLNLNDKKAVVAEISAKVASAQTIVVAEYRGIQVSHLTQLRAKARAQGVYLRVLIVMPRAFSSGALSIWS
jgi:large subunit ribosomal protein L10